MPTVSALTIINLIAQVGLPLAEDLIRDAFNKKEYTADEWSQLRLKIQTKIEIPTGG